MRKYPHEMSEHYFYEPFRQSEHISRPNLTIIEVDDVITCNDGVCTYMSTGEPIHGAFEFETRGTTHFGGYDEKYPRLTCYRALNCDLVCINDEE